MNFQFLCPSGHLLEGDVTQAGQQCTCPTCGMLFIIPSPPAAPTASEPPSPEPPAGEFDLNAGFAPGIQSVDTAPDEGPVEAPFDPDGPGDDGMLHIPCPNGHELETPVEMLDQDVLCPICNEPFRLRRQDSVEFKRQKEREREARERRFGETWFRWAIVMAVVVVGGLIFAMAMTISLQ